MLGGRCDLLATSAKLGAAKEKKLAAAQQSILVRKEETAKRLQEEGIHTHLDGIVEEVFVKRFWMEGCQLVRWWGNFPKSRVPGHHVTLTLVKLGYLIQEKS